MQIDKGFWKEAGVGLSKAILVSLFIGAALVAPGGVAATLKIVESIYEGKKLRRYNERQIQRALQYLRSRKLIDIEKQYNKEVFALTKLGHSRVQKLLKSFGIKKPASWDGKWRIVIFDIPETKKDTRETFRRQLRSLGLANVQKSIWVHPYDCRDQIFYLAGNMFIKPCVRYIVAEEITGEQDLKRRFDL